jgi:hypothetical protein
MRDDAPPVGASPDKVAEMWRNLRQPARRWLVGTVVSLIGAVVLAAGAGGWWLANRTLIASHTNAPAPLSSPAATHASELQMPDVRGLDKATAEQVLADSAVPVGAISTHDAPSVAKPGVVVEQSPAFGASDISKVDLGIAVPVTMPKLTGRTQDKAVETLSGYGTGVTITYRYSKDAKAGTVVSESPAVGTPLGQTASIVVATSGSTLPLTQIKTIKGGCGAERNVAINGHDYSTALACSAHTGEPAETTWVLSKTVDRFTATVGIADDGAPGTTAPYQVLVDGKVAAQGQTSFGRSTAVDVACTGAIQLTVRVGPTSNGNVHVVFGDAMVYGSEDGVTRLAKF